MKPGKRDKKTKIQIQGEELAALQNISFLLSECFGLDSRIDKYKGTRPIGLYQWDYECLISGIEFAINNDKTRRSIPETEVSALASLLIKTKNTYSNSYR
jgi:hypothetical protein